jgi:hypothetical protein
MKKITALVAIGLALAPSLVSQQTMDESLQSRRAGCMDSCMRERPNPELQRQEVIALERETARAVQLNNATFFNRVYSEDYSGVLSHGEVVNKARLMAAVNTPDIKYESFATTNIKVLIFRDTAVATCVWSMRAVFKGQRISSQMLVMHVYVYGPSGYRVVSSQTTLLPPYPQQPL